MLSITHENLNFFWGIPLTFINYLQNIATGENNLAKQSLFNKEIFLYLYPHLNRIKKISRVHYFLLITTNSCSSFTSHSFISCSSLLSVKTLSLMQSMPLQWTRRWNGLPEASLLPCSLVPPLWLLFYFRCAHHHTVSSGFKIVTAKPVLQGHNFTHKKKSYRSQYMI